jgi:hypothetical protein
MSLQDEKILGLTVWNPWAELIAQGVKTVENRNWAPYDWMLGRFLAIHASPKWDQAGADYIRANHPRFALDPPMQSECKQGVLAVVQLVGWVQRQDLGVPPRTVAMMPGHDFAKAEDQLGNSLDWRWFTARSTAGCCATRCASIRSPRAAGRSCGSSRRRSTPRYAGDTTSRA